MTKRERAIEAAAKRYYVHQTESSMGQHPDAGSAVWENPRNGRWRKLREADMTAAITEYERVMAEPDDQAEGAV